MADDIRITIDDREVRRKLARLESMDGAKRGVAVAAEHVKGKLATYPPQRHGPMPGFPQSERQRRYVMALIRQGEIPYRRGQSKTSKNLGQQWNIRLSNGGLTADVGVSENVVPYVRYVQDAEMQAAYHKITGWPTVQGVAESEKDAVLGMIEREIDADLEKS